MASIRRHPTPPGPVSDLLNAVQELHLHAGEPSVRQMARDINRGPGTISISSSTIYNVLSGRLGLPSWRVLQPIIEQLGGPVETIKKLWLSARVAQDAADGYGGTATSAPGSSSGPLPDRTAPRPDRPVDQPRVFASTVPVRNRYFVGREAVLAELHSALSRPDGPRVHALCGPWGIGKTEIAAEYLHRFRGDYDLVWWLQAGTETMIRESLIELGRYLSPLDLRSSDSDRHLTNSRRLALYGRVLYVFDNVAAPDIVARYLPDEGGRAIITSDMTEWRTQRDVNVIEVTELTTADVIGFFRRRISNLGFDDLKDSARSRGDSLLEPLASMMHGIPLAAELVAAYLTEHETPVVACTERLQETLRRLSREDFVSSYSQIMAAVWSLSREILASESVALLYLLSFFAPEPVSADLLARPELTEDLHPRLHELASSDEVRQDSFAQLARLSIVRRDLVSNTVKMHRLVRAVTRDGLMRDSPEAAEELRKAVHVFLAASDPGGPELEENESAYELSRRHLVASGGRISRHPPMRELIINQVRQLYLRGRYLEAFDLAEVTYEQWRERLGSDHEHSLALAVELALGYRAMGRNETAMALNCETMERLKRRFGEDDKTLLECARNYSMNLFMMGRYSESFNRNMDLLDKYERLFGYDHFQTLNLRNNIGVCLRCMGRYEDALRWDEEAYEAKERTLGAEHQRTLDSRFAIARNLRRLGRYDESLKHLRAIHDAAQRKGLQSRQVALQYDIDFSVALRRVGDLVAALELAEFTYRRHRDLFGDDHRQTLSAATNLINDRRLDGDLDGASRLAQETLERWTGIVGPEHPNTQACRANLAINVRLLGRPYEALDHNTWAMDGLIRTFSEEHPHCLVVRLNLASDLAAVGEIARAREMNEETLILSRRLRGEAHPFTLATAAALAVDRRAVGEHEAAVALHEETIASYRTRLRWDRHHPETLAAAAWERIDVDVEPDST